jgi:crotonobetainyl-CoA:carnitine CoA-transferase CaiB-like acyl-CoA transferase
VVYTDRHWRDFTKLIGCPGLMESDERFRSQESRTRHAEDVGRFLATQLATRSNAEWLDVLHQIDIPACPVNAIEDLLDEPHLRAVGLWQDMEHPTEGTVKVARHPVKYSRSPASIRRLAPNFGEHTAEVLGDLSEPAEGDSTGTYEMTEPAFTKGQ